MANDAGVHIMANPTSVLHRELGWIIGSATVGIESFDGAKQANALGKRRMGVHHSAECSLETLLATALKR